MGKTGESPALSRNCNPDLGEARIPTLIVALDTFVERGTRAIARNHAPLVYRDKGIFVKAPLPPTLFDNKVGIFYSPQTWQRRRSCSKKSIY